MLSFMSSLGWFLIVIPLVVAAIERSARVRYRVN